MPALFYQTDRAADKHMRALRAEAIEQMPAETPSDHRFRETARSIARTAGPDGVIHLDGYEFENADILEAYLDGLAAEAVERLLMRDLARAVNEAAKAVVAEGPRFAIAT